MRLRRTDTRAITPASPQTVYGLLTDGRTWPSWSPIDSFELEQAGDLAPEGIGAIRVFRQGRTTGRDQILELIPNRRIQYASLSGLPVRNYVGAVDLAPAPGRGTTIHWYSSFYPSTPGTGWLVELGLRRFLQQCAQGLAEYAASAKDAPVT